MIKIDNNSMKNLRMKSRSPGFYSPGQIIRDIANKPLPVVIGFFVIFAASFFNLVDLVAEKGKVGLDFQVAVKLCISGIAALYGTWGFAMDKRVRELLFSVPGIFITLIVAIFCLAVPGAIDTTNALASTGTLGAIVLSTVTAIVQLGLLPVLNTVFWALALFNAGSWFTYVFVPEIGVFAEPIVDGESFERMSGLAHSNTLGQFSGMTIVLGTVLWSSYGCRGKLRALIILSAGAALVASVSRTSLMATVVALFIAYRNVIFDSRWHRYYLAAAIAGVIGVMAMSNFVDFGKLFETQLASLTKSGEASELTSATGRLDIWEYSWRMIQEQPVFGYGAASSKYLLADHSSYTHNMVLNVMLSAGILAGLACLMMILYRAGQMWYRYHPLDGIAAFIIVNGFFENVTFSFLAGMPTIVWVTALLMWRLKDDPAVTFEKEEEVNEVELSGGSGKREAQLL